LLVGGGECGFLTALLGPFALAGHRFSEVDLANVASRGPAEIAELENCILKSGLVQPDLVADGLVGHVWEPYHDKSSLDYLLAQNDYAVTLLPVFARLGDYLPGMGATVISILKSLLGSAHINPGVFGIVNQYLVNYSPNTLDYSLYQAFFSLSDVVLNSEFFDSLIVSVEIWSKASPDAFVRIIHHWSHSVVNVCPLMFRRPDYFSKLLRWFRRLFYENQVPQSYTAANVGTVQTAYFRLLTDPRNFDFSHADATYLFSAAVRAPRPDLSLLCLTLIQIHAAALGAIALDLVERMHVFIENENTDIVIAAIQAIHALSNPNYQRPMTTIALQLKSRADRFVVFDAFVGFLPDYPGAIHLLCILALGFDVSLKSKLNFAIRNAFALNVPVPNLINDRLWPLWIFLLGVQLPVEERTGFLMFLARAMALSGHICDELDLLIDTAQLLRAVADFDIATIILDIIMALSGLSVVPSRNLLLRCPRVAYFSFCDGFIDPLLWSCYRDSPFCERQTGGFGFGQIDDILHLEALLNHDFANYQFRYGVAVGVDATLAPVSVIQYRNQLIDDADSPIDKLDVLHQFGTYLAGKVSVPVLERLELLNDMTDQVPHIQESMSAKFIPRIFAILGELKQLIKHAKNFVFVDPTEVARYCEKMNDHVGVTNDRPERSDLTKYVQRVSRSMLVGKERIRCREAFHLFIPAKMQYRNDLNKLDIFKVDSKLDFVQIALNTTIELSAAAKLWEFGQMQAVRVDLGSTALAVSDGLEVLEVVFISDIAIILPREPTAIEIFTRKSGSLFLDFLPLASATVMAKFAGIDARFSVPATDLYQSLLAKATTNLEFCILKSAFDGTSFHTPSNRIVIECPCMKLPAEHFFIPEAIGQTPRQVYENRNALESDETTAHFKTLFGDRFRHDEASVTPVASFIMRDLNVVAGDCFESGDFYAGDSFYIVMEGGFIRFYQIGSKPVPLASHKVPAWGVTVPTSDGLIILHNSSFVQRVTPTYVSEVSDLHCEIRLLHCSGDLIFFVRDECVVCESTVSHPVADLKDFAFLPDRITVLQANEQFNTLAVGTEGCLVNLYSITCQVLLTQIDLSGAEPEQILITPGWGLLAIVAGQDLLVFTQNGTPVATVAMPSQFQSWTAFADAKGFDYIAFLDVRSQLGVFEVFEPDKVQYLECRHTNLAALHYLPGRNCIVGLSRNCVVTFSPIV
jgi:hypothetical protein